MTPREMIYYQGGKEVAPSIFKMPGAKATKKTTDFIKNKFENLPIHENENVISLVYELESKTLPDDFWNQRQKLLNSKWCIISLTHDNKINSYHTGNDWTKNPKEAKLFLTQEEADERCSQMRNTLGRGTYTIMPIRGEE